MLLNAHGVFLMYVYMCVYNGVFYKLFSEKNIYFLTGFIFFNVQLFILIFIHFKYSPILIHVSKTNFFLVM